MIVNIFIELFMYWNLNKNIKSFQKIKIVLLINLSLKLIIMKIILILTLAMAILTEDLKVS